MNIFDLQATLRLDTEQFRRETEAAGSLFVSLGDRIGGAAEDMAARAETMLGAYGSLSGALSGWAEETRARWTETAGAVSSAGDGIVSVLTGSIPSAAGTMLAAEVGRQMASGLEGGFSSLWSGVVSAVTGKVNSLVSGVKDLLGIRSPSRVFSEIGGNMAKGLAAGWDEEFALARRTVEDGLGFTARGFGQAGVQRIGFGDSSLGRSSAAQVAALYAPGFGSRGGEPMRIDLVLDGERAATALYDPLKRAAFRKGGEDRLA